MKEILTKEEILALLGTCPLLTPSEYADKKSCQLFRERQVEWATNFEVKLEAFLKDHVSRTQLKKLHTDIKEAVKLAEMGGLKWSHEQVVKLLESFLERLEKMLK